MVNNEAVDETEGITEVAPVETSEQVDAAINTTATEGEGENAGVQELGEQELLNEEVDGESSVYTLPSFKNKKSGEATIKRNVRRPQADTEAPPVPMEAAPYEYDEYANEDSESRRRRLLEERMDAAVKTKGVKRKKVDYDDLERMQDDRIDYIKQQMVYAANVDVEKNNNGEIATEKLKMLPEVTDILLRADLAILVLDNNMLDAVRQWLEPLPDALMPAYQIQKELISSLELLPIKTDHLVALGIGKVLVFYQRLKRTEPALKRTVDRLIGDWTRPILNKSDSYKDRTIAFHEYSKTKFSNQLSSQRVKTKEAKSLYEENAARRNRAAIPLARTTAYKIAPRVDSDILRLQLRHLGQGGQDERFKSIQLKMLNMSRKKATKKLGPSIEGKGLHM